MIEARPLDEREIHRFYGWDVVQPIMGYAGRDGFRTVIIGGLARDPQGRVWGFIDFKPGYRRRIIYRYMARLLKEAAAQGITEIHVSRNAALDTSERLLTRGGFRKTDETIEGHEIWVWRSEGMNG